MSDVIFARVPKKLKDGLLELNLDYDSAAGETTGTVEFPEQSLDYRLMPYWAQQRRLRKTMVGTRLERAFFLFP
jgi:hypothetical protein